MPIPIRNNFDNNTLMEINNLFILNNNSIAV